jgi:O-antigen ligase
MNPGTLTSALVLASVLLLAGKTLVHVPLGILALIGVYRILRAPRVLTEDRALRFAGLLWLCIWVPMLLSLPDAVNPARAGETVLLYLHFFPAVVAIVLGLRDDERLWRIAGSGTALIALAWSVDALIQVCFGRNLLGYPHEGAVLEGAFYPTQRLGLVLAVLAPIYFEAVRQLVHRRRFAWLLLVPLCVVIVLTAKRSAWQMFIAAAALYVVWITVAGIGPRLRRVFGPAVLIAGVTAIAIASAPIVRQQAARSLEVFSTRFETADSATSYRLSLWKTASAMFADHWLNGVGVRGFRNRYADYATADDFWTGHGYEGQTHPHLMIAEIAAETGVIGLAGYALFWTLLIVRLRRDGAPAAAGMAWLIALVVAWFPLNAHLAFYGSYWSSIAWLALAMALAAWSGRDAARPAPSEAAQAVGRR